MYLKLDEITTTVIGKKEEETYTYSDGTDTFTFHAHPTKPWNWVVLTNNDLSKKYANKIINAFVDIMMECSGRPPKEHIAMLEIK